MNRCKAHKNKVVMGLAADSRRKMSRVFETFHT